MSVSIRGTQWWITVFSVIVIAFGFGTWGLSESQINQSSDKITTGPDIDFQPVRGDFKPLRLRRDGFVYKCSECHRTFKSPLERRVLVAEHTGLKLDHGQNDYCLNCHHKTNRDAYAAHDGSEIPSDRPAKLCGKCHGLVYRDWLEGAHGRLHGFWDRNRGMQSRLLCIQCHDPHAPKFPKLSPMPGPAIHNKRGHEGEH